jgi:DNA-binding NtrC family response regulator
MARILVVDDEAHMRKILATILSQLSHEVVEAEGVKSARLKLETSRFDLLITDQRMPDGEGLDLLAFTRELDPTLPIVFFSAYATVELAVDAMRLGAFDVIPKPFMPETVEAVVARALERTRLVRENEELKRTVRVLTSAGKLIGKSPAMREVFHLIERVAPTPATVLITGETGTGKELVARAIHENSPRAKQPFVAVNCAAFTETLLEAELFGAERGAYTGADRSRRGLFEAAHQGTLFLDEAGEMSLPLQSRLLRVLMNGEIVRVGSTTPRSVDVRILAATHRNLSERIGQGLFREDLYYRLAVVPVHIPPLRERRQDISLLLEHFLEQIALDLKMPLKHLSPQALATLGAYSFPGNIRELRNLIERGYILSPGDEIRVRDLPLGHPGAGLGISSSAKGPSLSTTEECRRLWIESLPDQIDLKTLVEESERELLLRALELSGGVQAEASRKLGISRSDLAYKLRKYGIDAATIA